MKHRFPEINGCYNVAFLIECRLFFFQKLKGRFFAHLRKLGEWFATGSISNISLMIFD